MDAHDAAAELFAALSSRTRVAIIAALAGGPMAVSDLADAVGVSQPLMSQHLRVLRAAHLVRAQRSGREVQYDIADRHVSHIVLDAVHHVQEQR